MNKLGNALYEIHHMDMLAAKDQWVNRLHPLVKLVLTIVFLTVTMSFQKYDLTGLLRMGIYPIVLFIVGEISFPRQYPAASDCSAACLLCGAVQSDF